LATRLLPEKALFNEEIIMSVNMTQMSGTMMSSAINGPGAMASQMGNGGQAAQMFSPEGGDCGGPGAQGGGNILQDLMKLLQDIVNLATGGGNGGGGNSGGGGGNMMSMMG